MKKIPLLVVILIAFTFSRAQEINKIDAVVAQYPNRFNSSEELAALINNDFETDTDKARAIYSWITNNVKFDIDGHFDKKKKKRLKYKDKIDKAQKESKQRVKIENKALTEHLALAEGYTTLYKRLCELTGLYAYTIKGTGKLRTFDIGKQPRIQNHMWNVVQIEKDWFFVDAMLGAGTVDYFEKTYQPNFNENFFFTPNEDFFLIHFPKDQGWLFVEKTADDFAKLPLYHSDYLKNDLKIVAPAEGVLDLKGQDSIQIRITSPIELKDVSYQFNYEKDPNNLAIEKNKDEYVLYVPFIKRRTGYLTLFYKKKALVSYKIGTY